MAKERSHLSKKTRVAQTTRRAVEAFAAAMSGAASGKDEGDRSGFKAGRPSTDAPWLTITGAHLELFNLALAAIMSEPAVEHVSRETVDSLLWALGADIDRSPDVYHEVSGRSERIEQFLREIVMPWQEFEALCSLDDLSIPGNPLQVGSVLFGELAESQAAYWLSRPDADIYAEDIQKLVGRTVATTRVPAGDGAVAIQRARTAVDVGLGTLRYGRRHKPRVGGPRFSASLSTWPASHRLTDGGLESVADFG